MLTTQNDIISNKDIQYINEVIKPLLPKAQAGFMGTNSNLFLFEKNIFKDSIFEYSSNTYEFVHFTSLTNALKILKTKQIRLSDLNRMSDKNELKLANNNLIADFDKDLLFELKSNIFSLSLCEYSDNIIKNEYMWREYGNNHNGVCIHLKLHNTHLLDSFDCFYLGKIKYIKDNEIKEFAELRNRHNIFKNDNNWSISNLPELMSILSSFYKNHEPYYNEKEIRLIHYKKKEINDAHDITEQNYDAEYDEKINKFKYFYYLDLHPKNKEIPYFTIEFIHLGKKIIGNYFLNKMSGYIDALYFDLTRKRLFGC